MKIRSFIFLGVTILGLFPLFIMVALNWPAVISRLEYAAELETQARSNVGFTHLNARIRCLKKSLIRSATLPSAFAAIHDSKHVESVATILKRWFEDDEQIHGLLLFDANGKEVVGLQRREKEFVQVTSATIHQEHDFFKKSASILENQVFVNLVDQKSDPFRKTGTNKYELLMSTPVFENGIHPIGVLMMRIDMSQFLDNFKDSYWVTSDGSYLRNCNPIGSLAAIDKIAQEECNAFVEFPGLNGVQVDNPVILEAQNKEKIAWMPLVFNEEHQAAMWVGSKVDESALEKWKIRLTINVAMIICVMAALVFFAATWIAARIEYIQKELLLGVDNILTNEKITVFQWKGPEEIKNLAKDLTALSKRYTDTCEARLLAESSLRESEDKFRNLTASALDGIVLMDREGNITYWNEAASTIFGFSSEEALGNPIHSLIVPRREGEESTGDPLQSVDETSGHFSQTVEFVGLNKKGKDVFVELSLSSTSIKGQWHAIWIVRDITERKRSEEESRIQQQHLLHADKMISLGLLVSGVAHEINNPNSIALLNLPILTRSWESVKPILDEFYEENGDFTVGGIEYSTMRQELKRIFVELEESAIRIKQIVVDLKDYARQETSGQMSPVDISEVVKSGVRLTANSIHKATNSFSSRYSPNLPKVIGNRQRLTQVIINLIQNSCEAINKSDLSLTITTRYNVERDGVEISIKDEGVGIEPDYINQVTDPFFTTKRTMGGTGLGLSVSSGIVKEHNGMMVFNSEPGKGTEVVILLPAYHKS